MLRREKCGGVDATKNNQRPVDIRAKTPAAQKRETGCRRGERKRPVEHSPQTAAAAVYLVVEAAVEKGEERAAHVAGRKHLGEIMSL